jgi:hypothetical protein
MNLSYLKEIGWRSETMQVLYMTMPLLWAMLELAQEPH